MKKFALLVLLLCAVPIVSRATSVTGNLTNLGLDVANTSVAVRFTLRNTGYLGLPRVPSVPSALARLETTLIPDISGNISGNVVGNDKIETGGVVGSTFYRVCLLADGSQVRCDDYLLADATPFNLALALPLNVPPVPVPPTADSTYLRLDLGNVATLNGGAGNFPCSVVTGTCPAGAVIVSDGTRLQGTSALTWLTSILNVTGRVNATVGYRLGGTAPAGHTLRGNGTDYVDAASVGGTDGAIQFASGGIPTGDAANFSYDSARKRLCIGPINGGAAACGDGADFELVPINANPALLLVHTNNANMGQYAQIGSGNQFGTAVFGVESTGGGGVGFGGLAAQNNFFGNLTSNANTQFFSAVSQATGTGGVSTVTVGVGGTGYTVGDTLVVAGGGNGLARVNVDTVAAGVVTGVSLLSSYPGNAYVVGTYSTTGGTGTGATVHVTNVKVTQVNATLNGQTGDLAMRRAVTVGSVTFANLGTPADGTLLWCSDCNAPVAPGDVCASTPGAGAEAHRIRGVWDCF